MKISGSTVAMCVVSAMIGAAFWVGQILERRKWQDTVAKVDTLYVQSVQLDTLYITKWKTRWDTLPQVVVNDTVWIPKASADSIYRACDTGYAACRVARDSLRWKSTVLEGQLAKAKLAGRRCDFSTALGAGLGATYGVVHRQVDVGPTVYAGVNLRCRKLF